MTRMTERPPTSHGTGAQMTVAEVVDIEEFRVGRELTAEDAERLEAEFLAGLDTMQVAYEPFVAGRAWVKLGYESFGDWWQVRVAPRLRALEMRPTKALVAKVIERVREEEHQLPRAQRRTQAELGAMVGASEATVGRVVGTRSAGASSVARTNLEPHFVGPSEVEDSITPEVAEPPPRATKPTKRRPLPKVPESSAASGGKLARALTGEPWSLPTQLAAEIEKTAHASESIVEPAPQAKVDPEDDPAGAVPSPAAPTKPKARRRPITDAWRDATWDLRRAAEKVQRLMDDDRYAARATDLALHARANLPYVLETIGAWARDNAMMSPGDGPAGTTCPCCDGAGRVSLDAPALLRMAIATGDPGPVRLAEIYFPDEMARVRHDLWADDAEAVTHG